LIYEKATAGIGRGQKEINGRYSIIIVELNHSPVAVFMKWFELNFDGKNDRRERLLIVSCTKWSCKTLFEMEDICSCLRILKSCRLPKKIYRMKDQAFFAFAGIGLKRKSCAVSVCRFLPSLRRRRWWFCRYCCVHWCFALKGQCHNIFCFRFFPWIIFPQASENPQICGLAKFVTFKSGGEDFTCNTAKMFSFGPNLTCFLYVVSYVPDFQTKPADDSQAVQCVLNCRFKNEYTVNCVLRQNVASHNVYVT
jgi:hypothetical protein